MTRLTHGMARTSEHRTWCAIRSRCNLPTNAAYANYGGRGIKVCERWNNFSTFLADMGFLPEGMSLDRRDNDGPYSPDNCRWASRVEQNLNRRGVRTLTIDRVTKTVAEWARGNGITSKAAWQRISYGWSPEAAVSVPLSMSRAGISRGKHIYETESFGVQQGVEFSELEAA